MVKRSTTMKNQIHLLILFLLIAMVISCDSVLDTTPNDRFTEDAVWSDPTLVDAFVSHTYRSIPTGFVYSLYNLSAVTDEVNARSNAWSWGGIAGKMTPDKRGDADFWTEGRRGSGGNRRYGTTRYLVNEWMEKLDRT